jgi:phosphatidylglycerol---prolipoprotein diacylglyceryl transferase
VAVPSLASGLAITRVGCYLFGCDFGRPLAANSPAFLKTLGSFPHWPEGTVPDGAGSPAWLEHVKHRGLDPTATHSLPVHPTQIYESLVGIALLGLLLWARKRQSFRGQIFFLFTFTYGAIRFMLELVRDDPERGSLPFTMSEHVLIPIALVLFAIGWAIGPSRMIESVQIRRVTHALAFAPAVIAAVVMRPASFAPAVMTSLSTSQFIGLTSALAVAVGYALLDTAAQEHPDTAMDLGLPEESPVSSLQSPADEAEPQPSEADGERISSERSKPAPVGPTAAKKTKKKIRKKAAPKREPEPED